MGDTVWEGPSLGLPDLCPASVPIGQWLGHRGALPLVWAKQREPSYREHPSQSVILTTRVAPRLLHKLNHLSLSFTLYKRLISPNFFRTTSPLFISPSP